jgi:two-component system response regulator FixJ
MHEPTVFIVDDEPAARKSLCALVQSFGIRAEAFESGEAFLEDYDATRPGCLVTDVRLQGMSGVELQEEFKRRGCELPVIVITAFAETPLTVRAMQNGAVTLLEKPCRDNELWLATRDALALDAENRKREVTRAETRARISALTTSERNVLDLIVVGKMNKQIATELDISVRTVESRRHNIFDKMKCNSLADLIRSVLEAGI